MGCVEQRNGFIEEQDRRMINDQDLRPLEGAARSIDATDPGPSFQRASILFVASISSFIGASLLLASI
jgi:hypothetical protein